MSFRSVGTVYTPESLRDVIAPLAPYKWMQGVCLHHTAAPSLAQRPRGFTAQHIINIREFYKGKGWVSGPHLFVDEDQAFGMTPLKEIGIHAISFNRTHIGIEVLGDYDTEDPLSGRGLQCWQNAAAFSAVLLKWLRVPATEATVKFHRDCVRTKKTCPGRLVTKPWVLGLIQERMAAGK